MKMLMFTTCAPFKGEKKESQEMAMGSWMELFPKQYMLRMGNDSTAIFEHQFDSLTMDVVKACDYYDDVKSEAPLLDSMLKGAYQRFSEIDMFVMINSDIMLIDNALEKVMGSLLAHHGSRKPFCGWARRRNCPKSYWMDLYQFGKPWKEFRFNEEPCPYHSYAGYDLFFWNREAMKRQMEICPPFVYNGWSTDHYLNWSQQHISNHQWEITEVVDCIHLDHEAKVFAHDRDWERCVKHNQEICRGLDMPHKNLMAKPVMLTKDITDAFEKI